MTWRIRIASLNHPDVTIVTAVVPELRVLLTGVAAGLRSVTSILLLLALIVRRVESRSQARAAAPEESRSRSCSRAPAAAPEEPRSRARAAPSRGGGVVVAPVSAVVVPLSQAATVLSHGCVQLAHQRREAGEGGGGDRRSNDLTVASRSPHDRLAPCLSSSPSSAHPVLVAAGGDDGTHTKKPHGAARARRPRGSDRSAPPPRRSIDRSIDRFDRDLSLRGARRVALLAKRPGGVWERRHRRAHALPLRDARRLQRGRRSNDGSSAIGSRSSRRVCVCREGDVARPPASSGDGIARLSSSLLVPRLSIGDAPPPPPPPLRRAAMTDPPSPAPTPRRRVEPTNHDLPRRTTSTTGGATTSTRASIAAHRPSRRRPPRRTTAAAATAAATVTTCNPRPSSPRRPATTTTGTTAPRRRTSRWASLSRVTGRIRVASLNDSAVTVAACKDLVSRPRRGHRRRASR